MIVIEMNPRVSRSSALASKATGFPIAKIAAKLAVGYTLDELRNDITGGATPASFEPSIDYVVTKIPRFAFEKFREADPHLTTQMKSVGEVMAIGRTFQESFQKALRGLETGIDGLAERNEVHEGDREQIVEAIGNAGPERILFVADAFRNGMRLEEIHDETAIDPWFLAQIEQIVGDRAPARRSCTGELVGGRDAPPQADGFLRPATGQAARHQPARGAQGAPRAWACARSTSASTPAPPSSPRRPPTCTRSYDEECEAEPTTRRKIMVLGGGPNRIGQGIEFDYCCVHAALAMREDGYETIMVNCNPETVSTDYDTSDRLYFEPVTLEDVLEIVDKEKPTGVIVQFGGQTPLKLALELERAGVPIIGTTPDSIDIAEDRERFQKLLHELKLKQPPNRTARTEEAALRCWRTRSATRWWCGRATCSAAARWRSCTATTTCSATCARRCASARSRRCCSTVFSTTRSRSTSMRSCDGSEVMIGGIMEHVEQAGVHSGDSACSLPPYSLPAQLQDELRRQTTLMAKALKVVGPDERAVRDPGRGEQPRRGRGLRARSQPARVAHGAVRQQGHRAAAGQDRGALHGRAAAERPAWPDGQGRGDPAVLQHQGSGVPVQQVPGGRPDPRPRDALHRRGDGRRAAASARRC